MLKWRFVLPLARVAITGLLIVVPDSGIAQTLPTLPEEREKVYILADSLDWRLAYHTHPGSRLVSCDVATRVQPGAEYRQYFAISLETFTVWMMASAGVIDSFVLAFDEHRPIVRKPSRVELEKNVLHLRGPSTWPLIGARRLRVSVAYRRPPGAQASDGADAYLGGEKQELDIDLEGFRPLHARARDLKCLSPGIWRH